MLKNLLKSITEEINNCTHAELFLIVTIAGILAICYMLHGLMQFSENIPY